MAYSFSLLVVLINIIAIIIISDSVTWVLPKADPDL